MDNFASRKASERQPFITETAARMGLKETAVEKDFWVCWTLGKLFSLTSAPPLTFKGGTSLSKVFKLITRFSEDIDISINREALGFGKDNDPGDLGTTKSQRNKRRGALREKITAVTKTDILPELRTTFEAVIGKTGWKLLHEREDEEVIVFEYPRAIEYEGYVVPRIKIDLGSGDQIPNSKKPVVPFVTEQFPDEFKVKSVEVVALVSERTFWEKVTLLHAENHRTDLTNMKQRMARHWSDVAVMSKHADFANEKLSIAMLAQVVAFKSAYFESNWANYAEATPATINIVPNENLQKVLKRDYDEMVEMFPDERLTFEQIIGQIKVLSERLRTLQ